MICPEGQETCAGCPHVDECYKEELLLDSQGHLFVDEEE